MIGSGVNGERGGDILIEARRSCKAGGNLGTWGSIEDPYDDGDEGGDITSRSEVKTRALSGLSD